MVLTPELERYTRALHKKLNRPFDILTDLHLKTAEQFGFVPHFSRLLEGSLQVFRKILTGFMTNWIARRLLRHISLIRTV